MVTQVQSSNYNSDNYHRIFDRYQRRTSFDANRPNSGYYSSSHANQNPKKLINDSSMRNYYPRPFRSSASTGELLNSSNRPIPKYGGGKQMSPNIEKRRKQVHSFGKGQYHTPSTTHVYRSLPSLSNNVNERKIGAEALVVGEFRYIFYVKPFSTIFIRTSVTYIFDAF